MFASYELQSRRQSAKLSTGRRAHPKLSHRLLCAFLFEVCYPLICHKMLRAYDRFLPVQLTAIEHCADQYFLAEYPWEPPARWSHCPRAAYRPKSSRRYRTRLGGKASSLCRGPAQRQSLPQTVSPNPTAPAYPLSTRAASACTSGSAPPGFNDTPI